MKAWQKRLLRMAAVVGAVCATGYTVAAQGLDTNLTAMVTSLDTTLTTGTGAHTIYWVVGLGVALTVILVIIGFVRRGRRA